MKYSVGDRVIVKESREKGIVIGCSMNLFRVYQFWAESDILVTKQGLATDLTAIEKPFGLLSKEVQDELKAVNNYQNIQYFSGGYNDWRKAPNALWNPETLYRLDPNWKAEEVKEMTVADVEKLVGGKVKIVKER